MFYRQCGNIPFDKRSLSDVIIVLSYLYITNNLSNCLIKKCRVFHFMPGDISIVKIRKLFNNNNNRLFIDEKNKSTCIK